MELSQSKTLELLCTTLVFLALFSSGIHAKDVISSRTEKSAKDDSGVARKVLSDVHNHIDKFSVKNLQLGSSHPFSSDNRALKKQFVSNKRLQKLLN